MKTIEKVRERLDDAAKNGTAADVAPVRHGTYISIGYDELYCDFGKCSVCGFEDVVKGSKYCPNCGAKMDGEK